MSIKRYNSQEWNIQCFYGNIKTTDFYEINANCITNIQIKNTLESYIPIASIRFVDKGFELLNHLNVNGIVIQLYLVEPTQSYSSNPVELNCLLLVNDLKILNITKNIVTFEVICTYLTDIELSKNIMWANNKEQGKISPYTIIKDVLNQTECTFDNDYPDTSQRIDFITSQNMSVKNVIDYCLEMGITKNDPPTYFLTRILDNKCMLFNQFSNNTCIFQKCNENLVFLTDGPDSTNNDMGRFVDNLTSVMPRGGINNMKLLSTHKFNEFDHNTRTWSQTIYNRNMISNLICQIDSSNETYFTNLMFPLDVTDYNNLIQSFPNFSQHRMYTTFRNIELTTKNVSFVLVGSLQRDAGQIIYLKTENTNLKPELDGIWVIYGCMHTWDNGVYTNDITCYKTIQQTAITK